MVSFFKLTPILLLGVLVIYFQLDMLVAAPFASVYAIIVAMITTKAKLGEVVDHAVNVTKTVNVIIFVLMFAFALAESFMVTGVGAAVIGIFLDLGVSGHTVAIVAFIATALLSVATGTAWGTFATCAPIFIWISHLVGGDPVLTLASIAGASCFGDCIGLINDTTILSSGLQGVKIIDRIRHQGVFAVTALVVSGIVVAVVSMGKGLSSAVGSAAEAIAEIPAESLAALAEERPSAIVLLNQVAEGVPVYLAIPPILVLILAFKGFDTFVCLGSGIVSAMIFGVFAGTMDISLVPEIVYNGFSDAGSWTIIMFIWVSAFGGIMNMMRAFDPIAHGVVKIAQNVRQLLFCNALLCLFGNAVLSDETAEIVTISPIIKEITDENVIASEEDMYKLRLRNSTFADALGVFGSQLIPWHVYMVFYIAISQSVYPLYTFTPGEIISHNYLAIITVFSMLLLTVTGLDRYVPLFRLPSEPDVYLKSKRDKFEKAK